MSEIFGFMDMIGNYDERAVKNDELANAEVDTVRVSDGAKLYETGVKSPYYDGGKWVIVEAYDTIPEAILGHDRWVEVFSKEYADLPDELVDCQNGQISQILHSEDLCFSKTPSVRG